MISTLLPFTITCFLAENQSTSCTTREEARQKNWLPDLGLRWISWEKALPQWALSLEDVGILGNNEMVFLNRRLRGVIYALVLWTSNANGQAGPPFRSDDPGTPGNGQWAI